MSWVVVKVGGEVATDERATAALGADLAEIGGRGLRCAVVHGGGPQATALTRRLGLEPQVVAGRRITDAETLEVMKMVLGGSVHAALVGALRRAGLRPAGLAGPSVIEARKRPPVRVTGGGEALVDLGHVGDVVGVDTALVAAVVAAGYLPVIPSLGADAAGACYNINADIVAAAVASALGAAHLCHLTGAPGVLRDAADPGSRIPRLTASEARGLIAAGAAKGGMIPKLEESLKVLGRGVGAIHIVGAGAPGALAGEVTSPGSVGTVLVADP